MKKKIYQRRAGEGLPNWIKLSLWVLLLIVLDLLGCF